MESSTEGNGDRCGEIFYTAFGDFIMLCKFCQKKFNEFSKYAVHVQEVHIFPNYEVVEDYLEDFGIDDQQSNGDITDATMSLVSKEDLLEFQQLDFSAPEHECKEIEDFVKNFQVLESTQQENTNVVDALYKRSVRKKNIKSNSLSELPKAVYTCPYCDATSHSRKSMNEHKLRHRGVLRHKCTTCSKAFFSTSELYVHTRTHTGERPFLCSDCGHKCTTSSALRSHIKSCRDIREAQCTVCNKMFRNEMYLHRHMFAHSDERAFSCSTCNAKFKQKKALQSHVKIHENRHLYKCSKCPASFNQRPGLYSHLKTRHKHVMKAM